MNITNIAVTHKEYRNLNDTWKRTQNSDYAVDSKWVQNMIDCEPYFTNLGGKMFWEYKKSRKFGLVPSKVTVESICGMVRKVLIFDYQAARREV